MKKIAQQRRKTRHALIQVAECGLGFNKLGQRWNGLPPQTASQCAKLGIEQSS